MSIVIALAVGSAWGVLCAAQSEAPRAIQPSPAFYQRHGVPPGDAAVQPAPAVSPAPAPVAPPMPAVQALPPHPGTRPAQPVAQPVPVAPAATPASTLPPHPVAAPGRPLPPHPGTRPAQPVAQPVPVAPAAPSALPPHPGRQPVQPAAAPLPPHPGTRPAQPVAQPVYVAPAAPAALPPPPPVAAPAPVTPAPPPRMAAPPPVQPVQPPPPVESYDHVVFPAADAPIFHEPPPTRLALAPAPAPEETPDREGVYWFWGSKWPGLALGPRIGTAGVGADLTFGVTRHLNLRGGFGYASLGWRQKYGSVSYDTDLDMLNVPLLVDLYPAGGHFRLVGGVFLQPTTQLDLASTPGSPVQIGNHTYGPDVVGTLTGKVKAGAVAPYLGIGFGNAVGENQWLTLTFDIGVLIQTYDVTLTSDGAGMTAKLDTFREDMEKERRRIEKDMDRLNILPVMTLGLSIHF